MPLAHVGHWLADVMYVMPVLVIVVWISIRSIIDRRRAATDEQQPEPPPA